MIIACHEVDTMAVGNSRVNLVVVPVVEPVLGAIVQPRGDCPHRCATRCKRLASPLTL